MILIGHIIRAVRLVLPILKISAFQGKHVHRFKGSMYTKFAVAVHLARPSTDEGGRNGRAVCALLWYARPHPVTARPQPWLSLKAPVAAAPPKRHRRTSCGPQALGEDG